MVPYANHRPLAHRFLRQLSPWAVPAVVTGIVLAAVAVSARRLGLKVWNDAGTSDVVLRASRHVLRRSQAEHNRPSGSG
jgi:hypothetical protein